MEYGIDRVNIYGIHIQSDRVMDARAPNEHRGMCFEQNARNVMHPFELPVGKPSEANVLVLITTYQM